MPENSEKSSLEDIVELLNRHQVEFIVVGGQAEVLYGGTRVTYDVDLCYRRTQDNLRRLAQALQELKPRLRGAPPDLPFKIDEFSLALGSNFTFASDLGDLDLLGYLEPLGGYSAIVKQAQEIELGNTKVKVIDILDLIRIKEHLGRPRDQESLRQLRAILDEIRDVSSDSES